MAYSINAKDYFNVKLWTGDGSNGRGITGIGFAPSLVWIKQRDYSRDNHVYDAVRGATYALPSNDSAGNTTKATGLTAFGSDGFTVGDDTGVNANTGTYVSWNWKANGQGSSNTDGSINTLYTSADTSSGVSISTWNGTGSAGTIGHGLNKKPKMLIIKRTDGTQGWMIYHAGMGNNSEAQFTSGAFSSSSTAWQDTDPTTSVFYVSGSTGDSVNASGYSYVGYAFADVTGFSKFGKYEGHSNTQFLYLGFKPAFFLVKNADAAGEAWHLYDNERLGNNPNNARLYPNSTSAEAAETKIDLVSNGVTIRSSGDGHLNNGNTFIYMAFAEAPLVGTNNHPCTAR